VKIADSQSRNPASGTADYSFLAIGYWLSAIRARNTVDLTSHPIPVLFSGVVIDWDMGLIDRKR
jgi:hypothetical protein